MAVPLALLASPVMFTRLIVNSLSPEPNVSAIAPVTRIPSIANAIAHARFMVFLLSLPDE